MRRILFLLLLPALLYAAGVTINETNTDTIDKIVFAWTSDSTGAVTGTTTARYTGAVGRVIFDPGAPAPSDNYDVAIYDQNSYDILKSRGYNKDSLTTSQIDSMFSAVANSKLMLVVVNAGDSTSGVVTLYIIPTTSDESISSVSDTTGLKTLGKLYYYTGDSTLYIGTGTGLSQIAVGTGDISSVTAGAGLSGGGNSGAVSLAVDTSEVATQYDLATVQIDNMNINDGTITNVDIDSNAAIAGSKLADNGITYAKLDTGATGFVDVRKFGAVGDGVTDDTDALRAAVAGGRVVYFPSGTYLTDSVQVTANTVIFGHNAKLFGKANYQSYILGVIGDNVKINGLYFDGNDNNNGGGGNKFAIFIYSADSVEISDCQITNIYGYGVCGQGDVLHNIKLLRNKIKITSASGLSLQYGSKKVWILDNYIDSAVVNGIQVYHASADSNEDIHISRNTVINTTAIPIEIQRATRGEVSNNIIYGSGTNGLSVGGCSYVTITGNCVADQSNGAMEIGYGSHISITGNTIRNCLYGIQETDYSNILSDFSIIGNMFVNNDSIPGAYKNGTAIELYNIKNCVIANNTITNPYRKGISLGTSNAIMAAGDTISGGIITGNIIKFDSSWYNISRNTPMGIYPTGINNVTISNNEIQFSTGVAALYYSSAIGMGSAKCRNVRVIDNSIIGSYGPLNASAIRLQSTSEAWTIKGNKVRGFKYGIHTSTYTGSDVVITDNDVAECTTAYTLHANHKQGYIYTNGNASFGDESPDAKLEVEGGGLLANDSLRVGAGGIWQRDWFYNAADSSVGMVFYNTILARIDTVFMKQPKLIVL